MSQNQTQKAAMKRGKQNNLQNVSEWQFALFFSFNFIKLKK